MTGDGVMIFLTVGSQKFSFGRLLSEVDRLVAEQIITDKVFAQIGYTDYRPVNYEYQRFLDQNTFQQKMEACQLVITHGGTGSIISALKCGKKVIAVPRLYQYGEHVDDHQVELLERFEDSGLICYCRQVHDLENCVREINTRSFAKYSSNTETYINAIDRYLSSLNAPASKVRVLDRGQKYVEYVMTKFKILYKQKEYKHDDAVIRYIYEKEDYDNLIVVFSSCTRVGIKARYNYVKTLSKVKIDKIFILDDYGFDQRGVFYLGEKMDFFVERAVKKLLEEITGQRKYQKIICTGSSKGGYAALNFGLEIPDSVIITGAPQYYLGNYLNDKANALEKTLNFITGAKYDTVPEPKMKELNDHLKDKMIRQRDTEKKPKVYIHYSIKEHTYQEHIRDLLDDMKESGICFEENVEQYTEHSEVSFYFPTYLLETIEQVQNNIGE